MNKKVKVGDVICLMKDDEISLFLILSHKVLRIDSSHPKRVYSSASTAEMFNKMFSNGVTKYTNLGNINEIST